MPLNLVATQQQVAAAINGFPAGYHAQFSNVRAVAGPLLARNGNIPGPGQLRPLVHQLTGALRQWGAGQRGAPHLRPDATVLATLSQPALHAGLRRLAALSLAALSYGVNGRVSAGAAVATIDQDLVVAIGHLAAGLFVGCTNVTYPMKALLLLTGFMPAFDRRVRTGLGSAGFEGIAGTQFLMPAGHQDIRAFKITRLPFYLGQCWSQHQATLVAGIGASTQPALVNEPGRVFDVLLFMQGRNPQQHPLFVLPVPERAHWYRVA